MLGVIFFYDCLNNDTPSIYFTDEEYISEHVEGAENTPLDSINENMAQLHKDQTYYVHCAGGYRSMIFASILKARGFENLIDVQGGYKAIKESGKLSVTDYVCPTTLKK